MVYIKRTERFCAAHKLWNKNWSAEKNHEIFGKCANENFHGHNYVLEVTIKGDVDPETGFVMNFTELKRILKERIIKVVDHKNLNLDIDFLQDKFTSAEVMAMEFWKRIEKDIKAAGAELHCITLQETENNVVEYYG
ncbi:MAG: 6-carboxytetrahydropterin synthase [Schleiferiaceae bacterium]|jgi:6-pyruvoyltetrahydropterin/6-carboxytetrahydropterin synthase|nr:6-carboxytetrahydropterin synthase [Schleiferiaceae bacterium]